MNEEDVRLARKIAREDMHEIVGYEVWGTLLESKLTGRN